MTPRYRSATLKLTLWYLCLVMIISLAFSAMIYKVGHDEIAETLRNQSARIYQAYPVFTNDPFFERHTDLDFGSRQILINLAYVNVAVLVFAGFASYWLARRTLEPIEAAHEQQRRFVADASHELRTPLTAIKMETEVALLDPSASKQVLRSTLESNLEEAGKLNALLESLLRLSRLEAGENPALSAVDLNPLIVEAVQRVATLAKTKRITVSPKLAAGIIADIDHDSFVQLLVILLDNAIKYSQPGSDVLVYSERHEGHASVRIEDHGSGIAPEALDRVFDRFYRADAARNSDGYGLGLSIAKYIADLHHATLTLTSTVGKGTTATVTLPTSSSQLQLPNGAAQ